MRKVVVTCPCGQRMQVSRAAYGKIGICPKCNQKIRVGAGGVEQLSLPPPDVAPPPPPFHDAPRLESRVDPEFEAAKKKFRRAVDLFHQGHYAQALTVLDELLIERPGNAQIETARSRCLDAMRKAEIAAAAAAAPPIEKPDETPPEPQPAPPASTPQPEPPKAEVPPPEPPPAEELTVAAVHAAILYLLRQGSPDSVRLQAAELACRMLGLPAQAEEKKPAVWNIAPANGNGKTAAKSGGLEPAGSLIK